MPDREGKRSKCLKSTVTKFLVLLAHTRERPVAVPLVVELEHVHAAPDAPEVERLEAPVAILVLPVAGVRTFIGECRLGLVDGGLRTRVGLQAAEFVFAGEVVIADVAVARRQVGLEEEHVHFVTLAHRHSGDHFRRDVQLAAGGLERSLGGDRAVHLHTADDHVADRFDAGAEDLELRPRELRLAEHLLDGGCREVRCMLLEHCAVIGDGLVDLAGGCHFCRWGHDFVHGVILLSNAMNVGESFVVTATNIQYEYSCRN